MNYKINMGENFGNQFWGKVAHIYELSASGGQRSGE